MGGGGKDSGSAKTYDYFGTVAGLVCWGPVDGIHSILVDGKEVFAAPAGGLALTEDVTALQPVDSKWLQPGGSIKIYRGTQLGGDPVLATLNPPHPIYHGFCYVVLHRFLFGRERTASPNVEVVVWRKPRPPSFLEPVLMEDGQVNPVPVMAELVISLIGLEQPEAILEPLSWTDAAQWIWADPNRRARMAVSALLVDTADVRARLGALLELTELVLAWNEAGLLELRRLDLGEIPAGIPTIDARHCTGRTVVHGDGWASVPTGLFVRFIDRDRRWKESAQKIDNILARQLRGELNREEMDLPFITRIAQAAAIAARSLVRSARPEATINVQVRSPLADLMQVGTKVLVDVEPEPGGQGLAQASIVTERRDPRDGPVALVLRADTLAEALPYIPAWIPVEETGLVVSPIAYALVIPLSPGGWGSDVAIAVLAARPQADVIGANLYFAPAANPDSFTRLGQQAGFAVRVRLAVAAVESAATWTLDLLDGAESADAYLASRTPDDPGVAAQDELLAILAQTDANGRVVLDADGRPVLEMASIVSRSAVSPTQHAYSVLRGRKGTTPLPWPVATEGWIVPLINVAPWTHPGISSLVRGTAEGRIRLVAFTRYGEDVTTPIPERGFYLPPAFEVVPRIAWALPSSNPGTTDGAGGIDIDLTATDPNGDLVRLSLVSRRGADAVVQQLLEEFPQNNSRRFTKRITFVGEGIHSLQASARDSAGHETVSIWQIVVPPAAGGGQPVPTFSPSSGEFYDWLNVTISVPPGHNFLAIAVTPPQPNPPSRFAFAGSVTTIVVGSTCYVWAASGFNTTTSPVVFASYIKRGPLP